MDAIQPLYVGFDGLFADDAARWEAVRGRDARADGIVYYAVATTGVYCRPTCRARRPRLENVRFFASCEAAAAAGYRPCKLCRPTGAARPRRGDGWSVRPAAIVFVDIKGFTRLAAAMPPETALRLLSIFHARLGAVVAAQGGVVHKNLGDGLMAVFGARAAHPGDADRAIAAGFDMLDALAAWNRERRGPAEPPIAVGIGVHYGMTAFADGSGADIIGDTVNVASRLERLTRRLDAAMIVSEEAVRALPRRRQGITTARLRRLGAVRLPGCRPRPAWAAAG